jgi:hypothetical protein
MIRPSDVRAARIPFANPIGDEAAEADGEQGEAESAAEKLRSSLT